MKKILVITVAFPPVVNAHSERAAAFTKMFLENGYKVDVITLDYFKNLQSDDYNVVNDNLNIYRLQYPWLYKLKFNKYFKYARLPIDLLYSIPCPYRLESELMFKWIKKNLKVVEYCCVLITTPPHSLQLIGKRLKEKYQLPFVMDLRDPWGENPRFRRLTSIHEFYFQKWYKSTAAIADAIIANTDGHYDQIIDTFGISYKSKCFLIPNGYDENAFTQLENSQSENKHNLLKIVYTGSSYSGRVLNVVKKIDAKLFEYGLEADINLYGIEDFKQLSPRIKNNMKITPQEVAKVLCAADMLILYMPEEAASTPTMSLKAYSYARSGKYVMYYGPENATFKYLNRMTRVLKVDNSTDTVEWICNNMQKIKSGIGPINMDILNDSWESRTKNLLTVIDEIT